MELTTRTGVQGATNRLGTVPIILLGIALTAVLVVTLVLPGLLRTAAPGSPAGFSGSGDHRFDSIELNRGGLSGVVVDRTYDDIEAIRAHAGK